MTCLTGYVLFLAIFPPELNKGKKTIAHHFKVKKNTVPFLQTNENLEF